MGCGQYNTCLTYCTHVEFHHPPPQHRQTQATFTISHGHSRYCLSTTAYMWEKIGHGHFLEGDFDQAKTHTISLNLIQ